jgi:hypothetical protein
MASRGLAGKLRKASVRPPDQPIAAFSRPLGQSLIAGGIPYHERSAGPSAILFGFGGGGDSRNPATASLGDHLHLAFEYSPSTHKA